jgi:hypothetical protein
MDYKQMCIQQGYVPSTCVMDGQMCWLLVKEGKDPCKGCMQNRAICNGRHAPYEDKNYGLFCLWDKIDEIERQRREEKKRRAQEIIDQRKEGHLNGYTRTLLEVKWERAREPYIEIIVKDCVEEKAYTTKCRDIRDAISLIRICCNKYNVEQIHIEENGIGACMSNEIVKNLSDIKIDIVPLHYLQMQFK